MLYICVRIHAYTQLNFGPFIQWLSPKLTAADKLTPILKNKALLSYDIRAQVTKCNLIYIILYIFQRNVKIGIFMRTLYRSNCVGRVVDTLEIMYNVRFRSAHEFLRKGKMLRRKLIPLAFEKRGNFIFGAPLLSTITNNNDEGNLLPVMMIFLWENARRELVTLMLGENCREPSIFFLCYVMIQCWWVQSTSEQ